MKHLTNSTNGAGGPKLSPYQVPISPISPIHNKEARANIMLVDLHHLASHSTMDLPVATINHLHTLIHHTPRMGLEYLLCPMGTHLMDHRSRPQGHRNFDKVGQQACRINLPYH